MEHIQIPKVDNVKLLDRYNPKASRAGTLYITTSHLIFVPNKEGGGPAASAAAVSAAEDGRGNKYELWIQHLLICTVEKPTLTTSGTQLRIFCSHFRQATFIINKDHDAHEVYQSLLPLTKPRRVTDLYCFNYRPKCEVQQSTGWFFHDLQAEFQRQVRTKMLG